LARFGAKFCDNPNQLLLRISEALARVAPVNRLAANGDSPHRFAAPQDSS
jgi:hypothetical protein